MAGTGLFVSVPVASFRVPHAREYFETLPVPAPATAYGMLLALVGEERRRAHVGAEIALARLSRPASSVVLRTLWRIKNRKAGPGIGANRRPDFQEVLTDLRLAVWVRAGTNEGAEPCLEARVVAALANPSSLRRFGGLSLGESTHLVDELHVLEPTDLGEGQCLVRDAQGDLALPAWVDHVGSAGTRWEQYRLVDGPVSTVPPDSAWTVITPAS